VSIGYIYILSNPQMQGLLKIGITNKDVKERVKELSSATGVPQPFEIEYYCLTRNLEEIEKEVHRRFSAHRKKGKEFFFISLAEAVRVIDSLIKPVVPDRFCRVAVSQQTVNLRPSVIVEKPFNPEGLKQWQEKRLKSDKSL
jgi:hypothetical protein